MDVPDASRSGNGGSAFDAFYYEHCCGMPYARNEAWLGIFGGIAARIAADMAPRRVLDAGCAMGFLVEGLRDRGIDAWGIDVSAHAIAQVHESVRPYCRTASVTDELGGDFDLIVSIEVVEHMPIREAEAAIANICAHTTDVLFSSSPLDYREPTHVNVHPPEYWAGQFARHEFYRDVDYDASFVVPWAVRFRKRREPMHRLVVDYERRYWELLRQALDTRQYSSDTQKKLAEAEAELRTLRADYSPVREERDRLLEERDVMRAALERAEQARVLNGVKLAEALDTIAHMETSVFWKLRTVATGFSGRLSRRNR